MNRPTTTLVLKWLLLGAMALLLVGASAEFYNIAWGTGTWIGEFSMKWGLGFSLFVVACVVAIALVATPLGKAIRALVRVRQGTRLRESTWLISLVLAAAIVGLLQYSPWGVVLRGPYLRIVLWALCLVPITLPIWQEASAAAPIKQAFIGLITSATIFAVAAAMTEVTAYPFSLGWSEGNRIWDYSLLFGRDLYTSLGANKPVAYLDFGRQLIGGLPFLLPRVTILGERSWLAAMEIVPYVVLGLLIFGPEPRERRPGWILASLATLLFLSQGPIHAPLVVSAILVAAAWRLPLLAALPLLLLSGYFAETSRFTWMFAPGMWALMLEIGGARVSGQSIPSTSWRRALSLGIAGFLGSGLAYTGLVDMGSSSLGSTAGVSTRQALLWYRLLPNATYGDGILFGLAAAAGPIVLVLAYGGQRYWKPNRLQLLTMVTFLLAFLVVGLVVSTKIGGGGDLHNLDMFLLGLVFAAGIVWKFGGTTWLTDLPGFPTWLHVAIAVMLLVPGYRSLMSIRPISFGRHASWLMVLTDAQRPRDLGSLPEPEVIESYLDQLRRTASVSAQEGDILFMDQRQLLTFGSITNVPLVPEFEKKRMMDEALSSNEEYFESFYSDLEAGRFSLLVSSPLRTPIRGSEYGFGEENDAWVSWVARPILCYYQELDTFEDAKVEMLVPRREPHDCSGVLPFQR